jgi:hypothetical protein
LIDCTAIPGREAVTPRSFLYWVLTTLTNAAEIVSSTCPAPTPRHRAGVPTVGELWQTQTEAVCQSDSVDVGQVVDKESRELVARVVRQLAVDPDEADDPERVAPTSSAVRTCLTFTERLAPHVALAPQLKVAAFVEDEGGISLVLQSLVTDRRLSYRIPPEGDRVTVIQIDERMDAKSTTVSLSDRAATRELAKWVRTRV